jgi:acyl-CoA synthetase (AMP-forming)/AMP-acid ligase II/acyl carrier protein
VLHTSGTTSRPKIVPLTQHNLLASAANIASHLKLTDQDRCLNIMPLFHIHGLVGALLSSLMAGASIRCTPGFYAPQFFAWLAQLKPTWYTAVPTMHQAILARPEAKSMSAEIGDLRLIRSSSSALPPQVMLELERVFGCPVIESYGMTEASHQMTSNPLPPQTRKPGSVRPAVGPKVAIRDESGHLLPARGVGEVVIRGESVFHGYSGNTEADAEAFADGWFRTGDQGYLDDDGYLFLTGRLKEMINRGGEKIAPREIDEALLDHPAVGQAVAFAVPHKQLGETVAAAVVLRPGQGVTVQELRLAAASRLSDFKVPDQIVILEEIPKGPTGKIQRIGLATRLGLEQTETATPPVRSEFVAPRTQTEEVLATLWCDVLGLDEVGIHDHFLEIGGDSVLATRFVAQVRETLQIELSLLTLFETPTIAGLAPVVETLLLDDMTDWDVPAVDAVG